MLIKQLMVEDKSNPRVEAYVEKAVEKALKTSKLEDNESTRAALREIYSRGFTDGYNEAARK